VGHNFVKRDTPVASFGQHNFLCHVPAQHCHRCGCQLGPFIGCSPCVPNVLVMVCAMLPDRWLCHSQPKVQ
jgi:hypothetical protein